MVDIRRDHLTHTFSLGIRVMGQVLGNDVVLFGTLIGRGPMFVALCRHRRLTLQPLKP